ncbi:MAG: hypothetical protein ACK5O7_02525 [Holosporales bacterium]
MSSPRRRGSRLVDSSCCSSEDGEHPWIAMSAAGPLAMTNKDQEKNGT